MSLRRFWVRKILGKIYNKNELFDGSLSLEDMNSAERAVYIQHILYSAVNDIDTIIKYLGEVSAPCDKCSLYHDSFCFKCEGTKVVQFRNLCDWPWE